MDQLKYKYKLKDCSVVLKRLDIGMKTKQAKKKRVVCKDAVKTVCCHNDVVRSSTCDNVMNNTLPMPNLTPQKPVLVPVTISSTPRKMPQLSPQHSIIGTVLLCPNSQRVCKIPDDVNGIKIEKNEDNGTSACDIGLPNPEVYSKGLKRKVPDDRSHDRPSLDKMPKTPIVIRPKQTPEQLSGSNTVHSDVTPNALPLESLSTLVTGLPPIAQLPTSVPGTASYLSQPIVNDITQPIVSMTSSAQQMGYIVPNGSIIYSSPANASASYTVVGNGSSQSFPGIQVPSVVSPMQNLTQPLPSLSQGLCLTPQGNLAVCASYNGNPGFIMFPQQTSVPLQSGVICLMPNTQSTQTFNIQTELPAASNVPPSIVPTLNNPSAAFSVQNPPLLCDTVASKPTSTSTISTGTSPLKVITASSTVSDTPLAYKTVTKVSKTNSSTSPFVFRALSSAGATVPGTSLLNPKQTTVNVTTATVKEVLANATQAPGSPATVRKIIDRIPGLRPLFPRMSARPKPLRLQKKETRIPDCSLMDNTPAAQPIVIAPEEDDFEDNADSDWAAYHEDIVRKWNPNTQKRKKPRDYRPMSAKSKTGGMKKFMPMSVMPLKEPNFMLGKERDEEITFQTPACCAASGETDAAAYQMDDSESTISADSPHPSHSDKNELHTSTSQLTESNSSPTQPSHAGNLTETSSQESHSGIMELQNLLCTTQMQPVDGVTPVIAGMGASLSDSSKTTVPETTSSQALVDKPSVCGDFISQIDAASPESEIPSQTSETAVPPDKGMLTPNPFLTKENEASQAESLSLFADEANISQNDSLTLSLESKTLEQTPPLEKGTPVSHTRHTITSQTDASMSQSEDTTNPASQVEYSENDLTLAVGKMPEALVEPASDKQITEASNLQETVDRMPTPLDHQATESQANQTDSETALRDLQVDWSRGYVLFAANMKTKDEIIKKYVIMPASAQKEEKDGMSMKTDTENVRILPRELVDKVVNSLSDQVSFNINMMKKVNPRATNPEENNMLDKEATVLERKADVEPLEIPPAEETKSSGEIPPDEDPKAINATTSQPKSDSPVVQITKDILKPSVYRPTNKIRMIIGKRQRIRRKPGVEITGCRRKLKTGMPDTDQPSCNTVKQSETVKTPMSEFQSSSCTPLCAVSSAQLQMPAASGPHQFLSIPQVLQMFSQASPVTSSPTILSVAEQNTPHYKPSSSRLTTKKTELAYPSHPITMQQKTRPPSHLRPILPKPAAVQSSPRTLESAVTVVIPNSIINEIQHTTPRSTSDDMRDKAQSGRKVSSYVADAEKAVSAAVNKETSDSEDSNAIKDDTSLEATMTEKSAFSIKQKNKPKSTRMTKSSRLAKSKITSPSRITKSKITSPSRITRSSRMIRHTPVLLQRKSASTDNNHSSCPFCLVRVKRHMLLDHALQCWRKKLQFACSYCPLSYKMFNSLQQHIEKKHHQPMTYYCSNIKQMIKDIVEDI